MIVLTVVPVLVLTLVATRNTRASVEQEIVNANRTRVDWAGQYIEELLQSLDGLFYSVRIDAEFENVLSLLESTGELSSAAARRSLTSLLSAAYFAHSRIISDLSLYVHATGEQILVDNVTSGTITPHEPGSGPWRAAAGAPVSLRLIAVGGDIYAVHTINRFDDQALRGVFAARVDRRIAGRVAEILAAADGHELYLLNDQGETVISSSPDVPEQIRAELGVLPSVTSETVVWNGEEFIGFARRLDRGRLTVAKTVPIDLVTRSARATMTVGLATGGLLAALSVVLSVVFSLRISRPISELAKSMQEASTPDFNRLTPHGHDEVRLLEDGYHAMTARMKALAQKEYEQEIELKNARLTALQAQINPHFLNNTLNLLGGMALAKGATEVYRLARAVSDMFRYAVGSDGDVVSLEHELAHVRNYLLIQENRFAGRCTIEIDLDPDVAATPIPRFTLQPLVENAFEHGLQRKPGAWRVSIRCRARRLGTMVVVSDNGVGMDASALAALRTRLAKDGTGTGSARIGLPNVNTRLRLHFGDRTRIRVRSAVGRGTVVLFILPHARTEPNGREQ
ncbi:MAG: sensor histidine kinase [Spirochaetaceae bacterium]|nr:MAG: sensor histidine kinase [Spirochaetaceae bacterium]